MELSQVHELLGLIDFLIASQYKDSISVFLIWTALGVIHMVLSISLAVTYFGDGLDRSEFNNI